MYEIIRWFTWIDTKYRRDHPQKKQDYFSPLLRKSNLLSNLKEHLISTVGSIFLWLKVPILIFYPVKTFSVTLRVIPSRPWSSTALQKVDFLSLPSVAGFLDVNLEIIPSLKGAFKTAHPGSITSDVALPPPLSGKVCVKQLYFTEAGGIVKRYRGTEEQGYIYCEVCCLDWARTLLDLTYKFIQDFEEGVKHFPGTIPRLHFVEAAVAKSRVEKFFLVEEWIDTSQAQFIKYINNGRATPCVPKNAPEETLNIANFLCFAQHVQFQVTGRTMFTSDYQGMSLNEVVWEFWLTVLLGSGSLLTDPQIITTP